MFFMKSEKMSEVGVSDIDLGGKEMKMKKVES